MDEKHEKKKSILKYVGLSMLIIGIIFEIVGFIGIATIDSSGYLWILAVIGIPVIFPSIGLISIGFSREFVKYGKNELSPILKEIKDELTDIEPQQIECRYCHSKNESNNKFCESCGKPLYNTCPFCGAHLNHDCKYCNQCGKEILHM